MNAMPHDARHTRPHESKYRYTADDFVFDARYGYGFKVYIYLEFVTLRQSSQRRLEPRAEASGAPARAAPDLSIKPGIRGVRGLSISRPPYGFMR